MSKIKIGCETYTWQMPGEQYKGKLEHIMEITSRAGLRRHRTGHQFLASSVRPCVNEGGPAKA